MTAQWASLIYYAAAQPSIICTPTQAPSSAPPHAPEAAAHHAQLSCGTGKHPTSKMAGGAGTDLSLAGQFEVTLDKHFKLFQSADEQDFFTSHYFPLRRNNNTGGNINPCNKKLIWEFEGADQIKMFDYSWL